jgi:hypothetical protein
LSGSKAGLDQDPGKEKRITGGLEAPLGASFLRGQKKSVFIQKYEFFPTLNLSIFH